jgi:asparagine synthase (glutamine-hydrolysing)
MCGIAGILSSFFSDDEWRGRLRAMAQALSHRGPDDEGQWFSSAEGAGMAHRRLSIIDLSPLGHQPMVSASGRYVISYNGEVYDFRSLRAECEKAGVRFRGGCDTEVILEAVALWGVEAAVKKCVGMFAFAVWDRKERALFLCRDRLGKKPLYYGTLGGQFVFCSELKALSALPGACPEIHRDALALCVRHGFIPSPYSIYKGVSKVPPGSIVRVRAAAGGFETETTVYWSLLDAAKRGQEDPFPGSLGEAADELERLLGDAVASRMISDVPLGAFLSGGVDSSVVAALMQRHNSRPVKTFAIGNREAGYDEAAYAGRVARHLGTDHTELYVSAEDVRDAVPLLPAMFDEPMPDSSAVPTYLVSKLSRNNVTVALTGDGGDEVFGGYVRYGRVPAVWRALSSVPLSLRRSVAGAFASRVPLAMLLARAASLLVRRAGRLSNAEEVASYLSGVLSLGSENDLFLRYLTAEPDALEIVKGAGRASVAAFSPGTWPAFEDFAHVMMYVDAVSYLSEDILVKVDRASMAVSLETRLPILDHRVVEFAWRLPMRYKMSGGATKLVLRTVLHRYVPRRLVQRPKMGFRVPVGGWLRRELRPWAEALLSEDRLRREGYFEPAPIRVKWLEHVSGERDWSAYLWNVLTFQAWLEKSRARDNGQPKAANA